MLSQNVGHQHLKYLNIWNSDPIHTLHADNIIAIVKSCLNLDSLEIECKLSKETVEQLVLSYSMFEGSKFELPSRRLRASDL
jgi:hypothetical protein